jgi:TNF receptor-associated protein 1
MRSTMMQSQQMRMFTTDNEKTIDITQASEEAEPIIT